jgi:hypothetical protein
MLDARDLGIRIALTRRQVNEQEQAVLRHRAAGHDASEQVRQLHSLLDRLTSLEVARDWGASAVPPPQGA